MRLKNMLVLSGALSFLVSTSSLASPMIWVSDAQGDLGTVDVVTGSVVNIGNMGRTMYDLAFDGSGNLWGVNNLGLYTVNKTTAASTFVGGLGIGSAFVNSLVFDASGTLFGANTSLYAISTSTGLGTLVGGNQTYDSSGDLAFIGGSLYLSSKGTQDKLFLVDTTTGGGTLVGNIGFQNVFGLASDNHLDLYGVAGNNVLTINSLTGAGVVKSTYSNSILGPAYGSAFIGEAPPAVPEPATMMLFGVGLATLAGSRLRKKHK